MGPTGCRAGAVQPSLTDALLETERLPVHPGVRPESPRPWSSLGGGLLSREVLRGCEGPSSSRYPTRRSKRPAGHPVSASPVCRRPVQLAELSRRLRGSIRFTSRSLWLLALAKRRHRVPSSATRTLDQLNGYFGALELTLSDDILKGIDAIVPPGTNAVADFQPTPPGWYGHAAVNEPQPAS